MLPHVFDSFPLPSDECPCKSLYPTFTYLLMHSWLPYHHSCPAACTHVPTCSSLGLGFFCVLCFLHMYWHLRSYFSFFIAKNLGALRSWCARAHFQCNLLYSTSPAREDCVHQCFLICLGVVGSFLVPFMRAFVSTKHKMFVWHRAHTRCLSPLHSSLSICPFGACLVHAHL